MRPARAFFTALDSIQMASKTTRAVLEKKNGARCEKKFLERIPIRWKGETFRVSETRKVFP
jgi:hypothetical protein